MYTYVHVWMHMHIYVTHMGYVSDPCISRTKSLKQKLIYTLTILYTTIKKTSLQPPNYLLTEIN